MKTFSAAHFISRELSWLEFNQRVLDEALNPANPLLERVKFFTITSSNLDEFFEVRVAGLKQQIESDVVERSVDGRTATETFRAMQQAGAARWSTSSIAAGATNSSRRWRKTGSVFSTWDELDAGGSRVARELLPPQVRPVLTPLGIDPAHPFPQLLNKSLNIVVQLEIERNGEIAAPARGGAGAARAAAPGANCRARTTGRTTSSWAI